MPFTLTDRALHPIGDLIEPAAFPLADLLPSDSADGIFDRLFYTDGEAYVEEGHVVFNIRLAFEIPIELTLPGIDAVALGLGSAGAEWTAINVHMVIGPQPSITLLEVPISLRVAASVLQPMRKITEPDGSIRYEPDHSRPYLEVELAQITMAVDHTGTVRFDGGFHAHLTEPVQVAGTDMIIESAEIGLDLTEDNKCVALRWTEVNLNRLLQPLAPDFADQSSPGNTDVALRVIFGDPIKEIRLDWASDADRKLKLPGIQVQTVGSMRFSVLLGANGNDLDHLALGLTFDAGTQLIASSTFAWGRDGDRELQNDDSRAVAAPPLFKLTATAQEQVSLLLFQLGLSELTLPKFFRQLTEPLGPLYFDDPASLCAPTVFEERSLHSAFWKLAFEINATADNPFTFPFLKQVDDTLGQYIQVYPRFDKIEPDLEASVIPLPVDIIVRIGDLQFLSSVELKFNWETFALDVDHSGGIDLVSDNKAFEPDEEHLGLKWRLKGAPITEGPNKNKFHYFTLVTKDYNYQIQQAAGAVFEVDYTRASDEPITFAIRDFALTSKGLNVTATVTDRPARLNGLDTRFRFSGSRLEIKENRIQDFTLSGSGPLPPALVGDSTADISLQFSQRDGALRLVAGSANLQGNKLLDCRGTRFRFSVDGLGLRFVDDGGYHLYFLLTGTAQFVPAPSDDPDGPLALLSNIKIDLVECPLTGDASVIAKHIKFLVTLPKPKSFDFLGCFEMELRAIGFVPQAEVFEGDGAMILTGQIKFAQGAGDTPDSRVDVHTLYIGLPRLGDFVPRIHLQNLPANLNLGAAFRLNGAVEFVDTAQEQGFSGEGMLQIQGLPTIAASFSFLRVRRDESSPWLRAWFIYLEVRRVSFMIPVVQLYLREVGLGFGYRYTLVAIQAADRTNDVRKLLQELKALSRTQGDLSKRDRWAIDLEESGQDPRWTITLRAMISQTSASPSPLRYEENAEKDLLCAFLLDAVIAFRSDLTFLMAVRAWINANYHDYVTDYKGLRGKPLFNGFVLLSPRQKRLLANLSSNPDGQLGPHPPLPDIVQKAISGVQFSATLLVEPNLFHLELGWPNMLRWGADLGPLKAEMRGGFIFRVSERELVLGISYLARAKLDVQAGLDLGLVGVRVSASADLAYGARFIGVLAADNSALYGAMGLEAQIRLAIVFWIRIPLVFTEIRKEFKLSVEIGFTAGIEAGVSRDGAGVRGSSTLSVSVMGHSLQLNVKFGLNEGAVTSAFERTERFLHVGLEATDVEAIPGVGGGVAPQLVGPPPIPVRSPATLRSLAASLASAEESGLTFHAPDYSLFVIRSPGAGSWSYLVLIPQGERAGENGRAEVGPEIGFLPAPPDDGVSLENDFRMRIAKQVNEDFALEQFDPMQRRWTARVPHPAGDIIDFAWKVNWEAEIAPVTHHDTVDGQVTGSAEGTLTLRRYLQHTFMTSGDSLEEVKPVGDPEPLPSAKTVEDERVHNPSDNSFEAAVRGAVEQFRGSPFFKRDPNNEYELVLEEAFREETTVYQREGVVPPDDAALRQMQMRQQALQLRGMVVQDLVADLREYVAAAQRSQNESPEPEPMSIAFEMGLVFRIKGSKQPAWIDHAAEIDDHVPSIRQRLGPTSTAPSEQEHRVRTFNVVQTDFSVNSPQFQRVQQLTDANTIAITWDLAWERSPDGVYTTAQADPEHHLMHYQVRRRALDGSEREVVYTVKNAHALHRPEQQDGEEEILQRLKPRFQVVDHFTEETLEDLAALPVTGRSYLYTITPVDFAGNLGRPLTVVATRYPNEPPLVPTDAELVVQYKVGEEELDPENATAPTEPRVIIPNGVLVGWSEPGSAKAGPTIAVDDYVLIFRKSSTMPIGSYGLDSTTQGPRTKSLPTTNARPLPTDIKIKLTPQGPRQERTAEVPIAELQATGVLPGGAEARWRPESWHVFMQTVSVNGVPSALAPVQLLLQVEPEDRVGAGALPEEREERRPAELEWLPYPIKFEMLPPEDEHASSGSAHVPLPTPDDSVKPFAFSGELGPVRYGLHPAGIRCIRFRWNQGPSGTPEYPLDLNAGYELLELDVDVHTNETFLDPERLAEVLRTIQDVQMVPGEDLLLTPGDTLTPNQWEAWYPSAIRRRKEPGERAPGSEIAEGPWFSWRESLLAWPDWPGLTEEGQPRTQPLHPFLQAIITALNDGIEDEELHTFNIDLQISPPLQPGDLANFFRSTAPNVDPYGWGVLQRFGLCVAFSLREEDTGEVVAGQELLTTVHKVLELYKNDPDFEQYYPHLHVELLFQPGRSFSLKTGEPNPDDLLAVMQLSLRPITGQYLTYRKFEITGPASGTMDIVFNLERAATPCSVVDQADPASGQVELEPNPNSNDPVTAVKRTVGLPLNGRTTILLRSRSQLLEDIKIGIALTTEPDTAQLPQEFVEYETTARQLIVKRSLQEMNEIERGALRDALAEGDKAIAQFGVETLRFFPVTNELSTYFTVPETLAGTFAGPPGAGDPTLDAGRQWLRFKRYVESLNSTDPEVSPDLKIEVPSESTRISKMLADFLAWSQRFFDASGDVSIDPTTRIGETEAGPWLATAYPRAGSPAYATPDESSRLTYDHLLEDQWAHAYRYYVRPYGRYDLLWQSLRMSPALSPDVRKLPAAIPDPEAGGLDVILERTRPVDAPLVLSSGRLDEVGEPARPTSPGKTWEVIVAQHSEQALVERNVTLARQIAFRQVAFTMLRRFAYPEWIAQLEEVVGGGHEIHLNLVQDQFPAIPVAYPAAPDHLDFGGSPLPDDVARSIDLPERIGAFAQGALALQWEALPFFYEHRLMLVAQTDSTISPVNEIVQRDFEYRSPEPSATVEGVAQRWRPQPPFGGAGDPEIDVRARGLSIPLQRFWDCLPDEAQERWGSEAPDPDDDTEPSRKLSSLPDREVVYQIVEVFSGNIEVQAELLFDPTASKYACRQLGRRFLAEVVEVAAPSAAAPQAPYTLDVTLQQVTEEQLKQPFDEGFIPEPTRHKIALGGDLLSVVGVFTKADRDRMLGAVDDQGQPVFGVEDRAAIERLYQPWFSREPISHVPQELPPQFADLVDFPEPTECTLVWTGLMSPEEREQLLALPGEGAFKEALERLAAAEDVGPDAILVETVPAGLDQVPRSLQGVVRFEVDASSGTYTSLVWMRPLFDAQETVLRNWARIPAFTEAVNTLIQTLDQGVTTVPLPPNAQRPDPDELPEILSAQLTIRSDELEWRGRVHGEAQVQALLGLPGDAAFEEAVQALIQALTTGEITIELALRIRPESADLPQALRDKLLIGRALVRYHGIMTTDEARGLQALFELLSDREAIGRLYASSLDKGMRGRQLRIRARRGSALPSDMKALEPKTP